MKSKNIGKEHYFSTQIFYCDLPDAARMNSLLKREIRELRLNHSEGIVRSNDASTNSWHSNTNLNLSQKFSSLCENILKVAQNIFTDFDYVIGSYPGIDSMWANINRRGGFNRQHNHPSCLWSGVYYVQTPENCGRLFFTDPRIQATMIPPKLNGDVPKSKELWSEVFYEAIAGRLILFPAWLEHGVEPNLSSRNNGAGERISVSFNLSQLFKVTNN